MLVELEVVAGDRNHRGGHRLVDIAGRERRAQTLLIGLGTEEEDPHRLLVGRRRAHLGEIERLPQQRVRNRAVKERIVGACVAEKLRESRVRQPRMSGGALRIDGYSHHHLLQTRPAWPRERSRSRVADVTSQPPAHRTATARSSAFLRKRRWRPKSERRHGAGAVPRENPRVGGDRRADSLTVNVGASIHHDNRQNYGRYHRSN